MKIIHFIILILVITLLFGCNSSSTKTEELETTDTLSQAETKNLDTTAMADTAQKPVAEPKTELPKVFVYNFHVTNRCVSCIAIEEATTKTLKTYFAAELRQGRIKQYILNVDDDANSKVAEKYQAFGSGLYVTRVFKGKETTTDLTGDGFKFAKNKEEKFIEILKNKITDYLK